MGHEGGGKGVVIGSIEEEIIMYVSEKGWEGRSVDEMGC